MRHLRVVEDRSPVYGELVIGRYARGEASFTRHASVEGWERRLPALEGWGRWLAREAAWMLFWSALGFAVLSALGWL